MNEKQKGAVKQEGPVKQEEVVEQWQVYWRRKQHLRRQRLRNYAVLIFFTALFGFVTIGLRLDLRKPAGERLYQNFRLLFRERPREQKSTDSKQTWPQAKGEDLGLLLGQALTDAELDAWGEAKRLRSSNEQLDVLYFAKVQVYLIRKKADDMIVYASKKRP